MRSFNSFVRLAAGTLFFGAALFANIAYAQVSDPMHAIVGNWRILNLQTGAIAQDCDKPQTFALTADGQFVDLTFEDQGKPGHARYIVLQSQSNRVLMFISDETRLTQNGDPVIWWAVFSDNDHFRWRRYDWPQGATTTFEWQRCPN